MGIDARILIRQVSKGQVTDEWLKELSWRLCESIGAEHFWLGTQHDRTAIERTGDGQYWESGDPPPGTIYDQDGPVIEADADECLLEVSLNGRYYDKEYERGAILIYCAIAEWCEVNIPGCEVWYGGDSSGVCAAPFTDEVRVRLRRHLYSVNGRAYFSHFDLCKDKGSATPPPCALCPNVVYRGAQYGFGACTKFHCRGCGLSVESRDRGATWIQLPDMTP